jgi:DNA-binding CsgD family transcriptional regulator
MQELNTVHAPACSCVFAKGDCCTTFDDRCRNHLRPHRLTSDQNASRDQRGGGADRIARIPGDREPFGVKKEACLYGLNFGVIVSVKSNNRRSFLSVAREDREVEDDEIETLVKLMNDWTLVVSGGELSQGEIEVLQAFSEGCEIGEVAETLKLSQAGVKKRLKHATLKLGAKNRTHAIAVALKKGFIDP